MARTKFTGTAAAVAQVDSVTPANVEVGDVFRLILGNHAGLTSTLAYTAVATTVKDVCDGLTALAAAAKAAHVAPWDEVTVTDNDSVLTVTASVAGVPFWLTTSTTNVGGGAATQTLTRAAVTDVAGPSIWRDPNNWGGTIFANDDDIVIPADCPVAIYGEAYTATKPGIVTVENGYAYEIGSQAHPLALSMQGQTVKTATLGGTAQQWITIDYCLLCEVRQAGNMDAEGSYGLNLAGSNGTDLVIRPDTAARAIAVGRLGAVCEWENVLVYDGIVLGDKAVVKNGMAGIILLDVRGGRITWGGVAVTVKHPEGDAVLVFRGTGCDNLYAYGGGAILWDTAAAISTVLRNGGGCLIDFDAGSGVTTADGVELYQGHNVRDRRRRVTWPSGRALKGCGRSGGTIDLGVDYTEA